MSAEYGVWRLEPESGCVLVILCACVLRSIESPEFQSVCGVRVHAEVPEEPGRPRVRVVFGPS